MFQTGKDSVVYDGSSDSNHTIENYTGYENLEFLHLLASVAEDLASGRLRRSTTAAEHFVSEARMVESQPEVMDECLDESDNMEGRCDEPDNSGKYSDEHNNCGENFNESSGLEEYSEVTDNSAECSDVTDNLEEYSDETDNFEEYADSDEPDNFEEYADSDEPDIFEEYDDSDEPDNFEEYSDEPSNMRECPDEPNNMRVCPDESKNLRVCPDESNSLRECPDESNNLRECPDESNNIGECSRQQQRYFDNVRMTKEQPSVPARMGCSFCHKSFTRRENLNWHTRRHIWAGDRLLESRRHSSLSPSFLPDQEVPEPIDTLLAFVPDPNRYCCDLCGKTFQRARTLQIHLRFHKRRRPTLQLPMPCRKCGDMCTSKLELLLHKRMHKMEKIFGRRK